MLDYHERVLFDPAGDIHGFIVRCHAGTDMGTRWHGLAVIVTLAFDPAEGIHIALAGIADIKIETMEVIAVRRR